MGWKQLLIPVLLLILLLSTTGIALANRPDISIDAQDSSKPGENVPVKVEVEHQGTGTGHYVDSIRLYDGDRLLEEWAYGPDSYVKDRQWSVTYTGSFDRDANLRAVAHCTIHGDGTATRGITVQ